MSFKVRFWSRLFPELIRFQDPEAAKDAVLQKYQLRVALLYNLIAAPLMIGYIYYVGYPGLSVIDVFLLAVFAYGSFVGSFAIFGKQIRRHFRRNLRDENVFLCIPCGYDLQGNESGTCPECGEAVEMTA